MTEDFVGTNGTGLVAYSASYAYLVGSGTKFQIQTDALAIASDASGVVGARRTDSFPSTHFSEVTCSASMLNGEFFGPVVRGHADGSFYGMYADVDGVFLFWYAGGYNQLESSSAGLAAGDTLKLSVSWNGSANVVVPTKNGSAVAGFLTSYTNANIADGGGPGVCGWNGTGSLSTGRIGSFTFTDPLSTARARLVGGKLVGRGVLLRGAA